jgi:spermidine/putrescine transport system ATP-binding protein
VVPRPLAGPPPGLGSAVSFSVRAEQITDAVSERHANRLSAVCTAVEYFGAVRRHVFERSDGEVLKLDQFGAHAARIVPGQRTVLGWPAEASVLHAGLSG